MDTYNLIRRPVRGIKLRHMLSEGDHSAKRAGKLADTVIEWARRDEAAGIRKDRLLFAFEEAFEEISDEIALLPERGEEQAYRDIYAKLYDFASEMMEDSYMPLYLYILYRYANALLMTGETAEAVKLFEKLLEGTERLIGTENSYGIHCLERLAVAAEADGQHQKALEALRRMYRISEEEFGKESAMAMAVRRFAEKNIVNTP